MDVSIALDKVAEKLIGWGYDFFLQLPNMIAAAIVLLLAWALSLVLKSVVHRGMSKAIPQKLLVHLLSNIAQTVVMMLAIFVALGVLKLDKTVTSLLAGAGVLGLTLALTFQDVAGNFLAGVLLAFRSPFHPGDVIETNGSKATVVELNLRAVHLLTTEGQMVIVPNSSVFKSPIVNYSTVGFRRVDLACGVAYSVDLQQAEDVAIAAVRSLEVALEDRPIDLIYTEFSDSYIAFQVRFWISYKEEQDFMMARSQAIKAVKKAFAEAGITVPFPSRTLDISPRLINRLGHFFGKPVEVRGDETTEA